MVVKDNGEELRPDGGKSQFVAEAGRQIFLESIYLVALATLSMVGIAVLWWAPKWLGVQIERDDAQEFQQFAIAWLGGILGGTAFSMKWLYHSVGLGPLREGEKDGWTIDRRLWRVFVPLLSGIMSAALFAALKSGLLNLTIETKNQNAFAMSFGFIVGYFSDRAAAKLREVAYVLFGTREEAQK